MIHYDVVAAVIVYENKYLCMQRGDGKYAYVSRKFEFPGGKIEKEESETDALKREIREEMAYEIDVMEKLITVHHAYPDFEITMHAYLCKPASSDFVLREHIGYEWLEAESLHMLDWAPADLPIVEHIRNRQAR